MRAVIYLNIKNSLIYADNAATSILDEEALEAMKPFLLEEYSNVSQPYSFVNVNEFFYHMIMN